MGPHLTTPSPQRTPVLYQAGSSRVGRTFAARHAEGTFIVANNPEGARRAIAETRRFAAEAGRDPLTCCSFRAFLSSSEAPRKRHSASHVRSTNMSASTGWQRISAAISGSTQAR